MKYLSLFENFGYFSSYSGVIPLDEYLAIFNEILENEDLSISVTRCVLKDKSFLELFKDGNTISAWSGVQQAHVITYKNGQYTTEEIKQFTTKPRTENAVIVDVIEIPNFENVDKVSNRVIRKIETSEYVSHIALVHPDTRHGRFEPGYENTIKRIAVYYDNSSVNEGYMFDNSGKENFFGTIIEINTERLILNLIEPLMETMVEEYEIVYNGLSTNKLQMVYVFNQPTEIDSRLFRLLKSLDAKIKEYGMNVFIENNSVIKKIFSGNDIKASDLKPDSKYKTQYVIIRDDKFTDYKGGGDTGPR